MKWDFKNKLHGIKNKAAVDWRDLDYTWISEDNILFLLKKSKGIAFQLVLLSCSYQLSLKIAVRCHSHVPSKQYL